MRAGEAIKSYRRYVKEGIDDGRRPELVGGGLIRSLGGWSQAVSLRRSKERVLADERILGSGEFVERIIEEADEKVAYQLSGHERRKKAQRHISIIQKELGQVDSKDLPYEIPKGGSEAAFHRVNEVDPLTCPTCQQGQMRILVL